MKELLQQKAEALYEITTIDEMNQRIMVARLAFVKGAKEILDNPELYGLVKKDKYSIEEMISACPQLLSTAYASSEVAPMMQRYADQEKRELEKENKELKDKVTELETVINKLSKRIITGEYY